MSDSSDRSQRLRDDESRSSDGSRAAGSITNYFAPDEDEEVPVETLIDSVPDILAIDIVPPAGRYDSIFNGTHACMTYYIINATIFDDITHSPYYRKHRIL